MLHVPTRPNQLWVCWSPSQFTRAKVGGFSLQTPLYASALSSCSISSHKAEIFLSPSLTQSHQSVPRPCSQSQGHLRLMDAAVVENEIHRGKLLPRLLGFQVELHHSLVPWERRRQKKASERTRLRSPEFSPRLVLGWRELGITTQPT